MSNQELKSGWVEKQGGIIKSWKKRFVVVSRDVVSYYTSEQRSKKKGIFAVRSITKVEERPAISNHENVIALVTDKRTYLFSFTSPDQRDDWFLFFQELIDRSSMKSRFEEEISREATRALIRLEETPELRVAQKAMEAQMPEDPDKAVSFTDSIDNPLARELVNAWPERESGQTYTTSFCSFSYPTRFWRVREEREGLEIVLETLMGINARVWVDELTPACSSMEYLKGVNQTVSALMPDVDVTDIKMQSLPACGLSLASCSRSWVMPYGGERIMVPIRQFSIHGTTVNDAEDTCIAYNTTISCGQGLWPHFEPLFRRFLSTLAFRNHDECVAAVRKITGS